MATAGFYGAVSATHEETSETTSTTATQARGAQLVSLNGSTTLDAANDLRIEGSTVAAQQGDVTLKGTEVTIEAAKNTHQTTVRSDHQRTTAEVFNTAGMPTLPTHTQQEFSGDATTITHAQSRVQAGSGKVTIETSGDATVTGAQVEGRDVAMAVGGTLTVSSVQNSTTSRGRTTGFSVGGTMGIENGHQRTHRAWVDEQTHVVGSDSVNVEAKTLELTGAVVANASIERDAYGKVDKMTDQGNLTIEVADVTVSDVSNRDEHESSYVGVDVSGFSGAVQVPQGGSMGIRVSTGGHHKAGVTAATLGEGSLSAERVTVVTSDKSKTGSIATFPHGR